MMRRFQQQISEDQSYPANNIIISPNHKHCNYYYYYCVVLFSSVTDYDCSDYVTPLVCVVQGGWGIQVCM